MFTYIMFINSTFGFESIGPTNEQLTIRFLSQNVDVVLTFRLKEKEKNIVL